MRLQLQVAFIKLKRMHYAKFVQLRELDESDLENKKVFLNEVHWL